MYTNPFLKHHGIKGQKWGVVNGPPYPLGRSEMSASERKTNVRSAKSKKKSFYLSDRQKTALKIGTAAVATALVAYGGYKLYQSGALDNFVSSGKNEVENILRVKVEPNPSGDLSLDAFKDVADGNETLGDSLRTANPLRGTVEGKNNCTYSAIAGFLRQHYGKDVVALGTGGEQKMLGGVVEECFKGAKIFDGTAVKFGKSPEDAAEMLVKRYGDNASGAVSIQWKKNSPIGEGGHTFSWDIIDGQVKFRDYQAGKDNSYVRQYWKFINPNDSLTIARLDQTEPIEEGILKCVRSRE